RSLRHKDDGDCRRAPEVHAFLQGETLPGAHFPICENLIAHRDTGIFNEESIVNLLRASLSDQQRELNDCKGKSAIDCISADSPNLFVEAMFSGMRTCGVLQDFHAVRASRSNYG